MSILLKFNIHLFFRKYVKNQDICRNLKLLQQFSVERNIFIP